MLSQMDYSFASLVLAQAEEMQRRENEERVALPYKVEDPKLTQKAKPRVGANDPEALRAKANEFHGRVK